MAESKEREKPAVPKEVEHRPEEMPAVSPELKEAGVQTTKAQVTAQVTDDSGRQLIQTPTSQNVTIQIPATEDQLEDWSHGSPASSLTWFAAFWLRLIKKAIHFGWKVVTFGGRK